MDLTKTINDFLQGAGLFIFLVIMVLIFVLVKNSPKNDDK